MTRINLVCVTELTDQHVMAEYRVGKPIPRELVEMARLAFEAGQGQLTRAVGDGGPAFPVRAASGMSLRDWFAAHASEQDMEAHSRTEVQSRTVRVNGLPGMPDATHQIQTKRWPRTREEARYAYADAMLLARRSQTP